MNSFFYCAIIITGNALRYSLMPRRLNRIVLYGMQKRIANKNNRNESVDVEKQIDAKITLSV